MFVYECFEFSESAVYIAGVPLLIWRKRGAAPASFTILTFYDGKNYWYGNSFRKHISIVRGYGIEYDGASRPSD